MFAFCTIHCCKVAGYAFIKNRNNIDTLDVILEPTRNDTYLLNLKASKNISHKFSKSKTDEKRLLGILLFYGHPEEKKIYLLNKMLYVEKNNIFQLSLFAFFQLHFSLSLQNVLKRNSG